EAAREAVDYRWLRENAIHSNPRVRALAALVIRAHGDQGTESLHRLLADTDRSVVREAVRTAGVLRSRDYVTELISLLADSRFRGDVVSAMACYGSRIVGTLSDNLADTNAPIAVRRQIPRV